MENYDRKNQMKEIHRRKKANTEIKVNTAIERLLKENIEINFNVVSKYANVSKATLYIESLKRKIKKLEKENKSLKDEVNVLYNKIYENF